MLQAYLCRLQLAVLVLQLCLHLLLTGPQALAACLLSLLQTQQQPPAQQVGTYAQTVSRVRLSI